MSAATRSLVMAPQTGRPTEELTRAFPVLILVLTFIKDIRGLSFDVPPTLPVDGSKHWLVGGKINICTSPYTPMVSCALGEHLKPDKVGGFYTELAKLTFRRVGWTENDYVFTCMNWDDMERQLVEPNGTCYMSTAGMSMTVDRAMKGMKFSWPNFHNELVILVAADLTDSNTWGFLTPFSWQVWVALVTTSLLVGLLVWLAEWASTQRQAQGSKFSRATLKAVGYSTWQAAGKISAVTQELDKVNTLAARIIVWAYGLLMMVILATYTANTAAQLTAVSLQTNVHGLADLRGKAVGTWDGYARIFNGSNALDYPFTPLYFPWENEGDEAVMLSALRSGRIVALIIDQPFAAFKATEHCDLHIVGDSFEPNDLSLVFPKSFPSQEIIQTFSEALRANDEQWLTKPIYLKYFNFSTTCDPVNTSGAITLTQLLGLWYILAIATGVAVICIVASHISWATGTNRAVAQHTRSFAKSITQSSRAASFGMLSLARSSLSTRSEARPSEASEADFDLGQELPSFRHTDSYQRSDSYERSYPPYLGRWGSFRAGSFRTAVGTIPKWLVGDTSSLDAQEGAPKDMPGGLPGGTDEEARPYSPGLLRPASPLRAKATRDCGPSRTASGRESSPPDDYGTAVHPVPGRCLSPSHLRKGHFTVVEDEIWATPEGEVEAEKGLELASGWKDGFREAPVGEHTGAGSLAPPTLEEIIRATEQMQAMLQWQQAELDAFIASSRLPKDF